MLPALLVDVVEVLCALTGGGNCQWHGVHARQNVLGINRHKRDHRDSVLLTGRNLVKNQFRAVIAERSGSIVINLQWVIAASGGNRSNSGNIHSRCVGVRLLPVGILRIGNWDNRRIEVGFGILVPGKQQGLGPKDTGNQNYNGTNNRNNHFLHFKFVPLFGETILLFHGI